MKCRDHLMTGQERDRMKKTCVNRIIFSSIFFSELVKHSVVNVLEVTVNVDASTDDIPFHLPRFMPLFTITKTFS